MFQAAMLERKVKRAFHDVPWPSEPLTVGVGMGSEPTEVAEAFAGTHWKEISSTLVRSQPDALAFFSVPAFRFYLPGYLLLALKDREGMDVALDSLLSALAGPVHQEERMEALTGDQLEVVLEVLETITPSEDDPSFWDFGRAREAVLERLTRPRRS